MKRLYFILLFLSALWLLSCQKEQMFIITTSVSPEGAGTVSPSSMEAQEGSVEFKVINSSGQDFYLDEIRIRKAL